MGVINGANLLEQKGNCLLIRCMHVNIRCVSVWLWTAITGCTELEDEETAKYLQEILLKDKSLTLPEFNLYDLHKLSEEARYVSRVK